MRHLEKPCGPRVGSVSERGLCIVWKGRVDPGCGALVEDRR